MNTTDMKALLGHAYDELDEDTRDQLQRVLDNAPADMADSIDYANGAMMVAFGDLTVEEAAAAWEEAQRIAVATREELIGAVLMARAQGASEYQLAEYAGVSRMTIRRWQNASPTN